MVGIKTTFKVGDKEIEWKSVIKWMLEWAQKQEYEKKDARDSFVNSGKIIFEDIKWAWRREKNKELYAKLYHVASKCGLGKECVSWEKSGKVLSDRIAKAKNKGSIGAYIDTFYQKDSDDWKNAYAAFDLKATEQKEKLKKSKGTDETKVVKPGLTIDKQEYDKRYRERKRQQGCVLGDACKCKGLANEAMILAPGKAGFIHIKCLKRTCAECKITGTAENICMVSPNKPGEFVHPHCLKRTCAKCKETGTAENICLVSPNKPDEHVHRECLKRTCSFCGKKADARTIFRNRRCSTPGNPVFSCRSEACRFQFPFTDPNGCAFCGRKFTCSNISLDSMKRIIARHEMKIKPKRDACSGCFWRKFHLHQAAKRDKELERIDKLTKKDMSKLYEKLRKLMTKMKQRYASGDDEMEEED